MVLDTRKSVFGSQLWLQLCIRFIMTDTITKCNGYVVTVSDFLLQNGSVSLQNTTILLQIETVTTNAIVLIPKAISIL